MFIYMSDVITGLKELGFENLKMFHCFSMLIYCIKNLFMKDLL